MNDNKKKENNKPDKPEKAEEEIPFREEALERIAVPDELNLLFTPITYRKKFIRWTIAGFLLIVFAWAFFGSIPIDINGRAIVMNRQGLFSIEAKTAGIVKEILVKPGQSVQKGQLLMRLSDPEEEKKYASSLIQAKKLEENVAKLKEQIHIELLARRESIQQQIIASHTSIKELENSIVQLEKELQNKEELFKQHLIGLNEIHDTRQLLSQRKIALETTKGTLATLEANLTQSYREQELLGKERELLQAQQESELLKISLNYLDVTSTDAGTVLSILVNPGDHVSVGIPLVRLEYKTKAQQTYIFYAYIPAEYGKKVQLGTNVIVELSTVRAEEYGAILGKVIQVSPYPVSRENIGNTIQNEGLVDYLMGGNKTVVELVIEPELDPTTPSGFKWTSGKGPNIKISTGTVAYVKGLVERVTPIFYLFSLWRLEKLDTDIEKYFEHKPNAEPAQKNLK